MYAVLWLCLYLCGNCAAAVLCGCICAVTVLRGFAAWLFCGCGCGCAVDVAVAVAVLWLWLCCDCDCDGDGDADTRTVRDAAHPAMAQTQHGTDTDIDLAQTQHGKDTAHRHSTDTALHRHSMGTQRQQRIRDRETESE